MRGHKLDVAFYKDPIPYPNLAAGERVTAASIAPLALRRKTLDAVTQRIQKRVELRKVC
jgi:hypothetical protein